MAWCSGFVALGAAGYAREQVVLHAALDRKNPAAGSWLWSRSHQDGETVDPSSPVVTLAKSGSVVVTAQFAPNDADRVHLGDAADVRFNGVDVPVRGRVVALNSAQTSDARTVPVLIGFDRAGVAFGAGAYGKATIRVGSQRGVYVPSGAVVSDPTTGVTRIFRKRGERFEPVPIAVVGEAEGRTWLRAKGVRVGDVVVTQGAYALLAPPASPNADSDAK